MEQWAKWLADNWLKVAIPLLVFLACYAIGLWARRAAYNAYKRWVAGRRWEGSPLVEETIRRSFLHWFILLGAYIAIEASVLSPRVEPTAGRMIGSLFVLSLMWIAVDVSGKLLKLYLARMEAVKPATAWAINITRASVLVIGLLILLDIWGAPTTPVLLALLAGVFIAGLAMRDTILNLFAKVQIVQGGHVKPGDFVRLGSGEAGYVTEVTWQHTRIRAPDGDLVLIPNSVMARSTMINYGRAIKRARLPFRFYHRFHLKEITGLKASSLIELAGILRELPDSVVYFHTHHFLEEHHYLTPEPANDFALWVRDALDNEVLGERLASIDTFDFLKVEALRTRLVEVIQDYLAKNPDGGKAPEGREFRFIESISVVLASPYVAHDLREFAEVMKKITLDSIYFHVFEARLRLQKNTNDFSLWMRDNLDEPELADEIARLDPYTHTLESLRARIIELIERRLR